MLLKKIKTKQQTKERVGGEKNDKTQQATQN